MQYLLPANLESALAAMAGGPWTVLAGGTDYYPARVGRPLTDSVIDLSGLTELRGITVGADHYRIGALTRWADIRDAGLPRCFDGLRLAAREVGAVQVQNAGTIGGNLCNASPAADGVPPLLTLNAAVELTSEAGSRVVPLPDFLTAYRQTDLRPGELLTAVVVPREAETAASDFLKLGSRSYLVISIAMVASVIRVSDDGVIDDARLAVGACSPVAMRLPELEADLKGRNVGDQVERIPGTHHLGPLSPIDDVRAPAAYRLEAVVALIRRLLERTRDAA